MEGIPAMKLPIVIRIAPLGERQWVTTGLFAFAAGMMLMAWDDPKLWETKLFEVILQAIVLTGLLNMILAFHFSANKSDETKSANTGKAFDAIKAAANAGGEPLPDVILEPGETAQAADAPKPD